MYANPFFHQDQGQMQSLKSPCLAGTDKLHPSTELASAEGPDSGRKDTVCKGARGSLSLLSLCCAHKQGPCSVSWAARRRGCSRGLGHVTPSPHVITLFPHWQARPPGASAEDPQPSPGSPSLTSHTSLSLPLCFLKTHDAPAVSTPLPVTHLPWRTMNSSRPVPLLRHLQTTPQHPPARPVSQGRTWRRHLLKHHCHDPAESLTQQELERGRGDSCKRGKHKAT